MSINDITVVITSFKSGKSIEKCLNSINPSCKIIVIENSDNLDIKKNIEQKFTNVECHLTGKNLGYGKANNIGIEKTKTKYVLILNPDTVLHPMALENFFKAAKEDPNFAIIGPYIQEKDKENENYKKNFGEKNLLSVDNVKGFAMFLNILQFKNIGFFDENFFFYFEEIDLCKRLKNIGKKIYLAPNIKIDHEGGKSHDKNINREMELSRNWHWMWSTFYYYKKYNGFYRSFLIILPKLISALYKIFFYTLIFNKEKKIIYYYRYLGLFNAIIGKDSWYRPKV